MKKIAPSILSADFGKLAEEIQKVEAQKRQLTELQSQFADWNADQGSRCIRLNGCLCSCR